MAKEKIADGTVHKISTDLKNALISTPAALEAWQSLTPLARNEWICWNITVKQLDTRKNHIKRTITELQEGKRRPCCWLGCIHRKDKKLSPSVKGILSKKTSYLDILSKSKGTWGKSISKLDDFQKRKLELKASEERKKKW